MWRYTADRLAQAIFVLLLVSVIVFMLVRLVPQDPIYARLGPDAEGYSPAQREALMHEFGLDRPLPFQYLIWVKGFLTGNWGASFQTRQPVLQVLKSRIPYTLELAAVALLISIAVGVSAGVVAALKRNSLTDMLATAGAMVGVAVPEFWLALMMILFFGVTLGVLPVYGAALVWQDPVAGIRHLALPALALGIGGAATLMRQTRSAMLETMGEDYIRTARSKGVKEGQVIWSHALRNSLLPVVTILGVRIGGILGGAVVIETMFSWPGVGRLAVIALQKADYPVIVAVVMITAMAVVTANLITDLAYSYLDPRIRYS